MRLEKNLILNRYLLNLFGVRSLEHLKQSLQNVAEGQAGDGQSYFYGALLGQTRDDDLKNKIAEYDRRVMDYETRLAKARGAFFFKYFQYLSSLLTEIYLDRLTDDPQKLLNGLNRNLARLKGEEISLGEFPHFTAEDLKRLAYFMATGSGKTLLLHVNLWQILHYLERGRHPEALVQRADGRREFDSILLVTPNEGLSQQHLEEFGLSDIEAVLLAQNREDTNFGLFGPKVKIIEIHKLAEEPSKEGVSILLDELGTANLVFVDEGHKGTGSEAQKWKNKQKKLSANGFLVEYSATFAQAIGAATARNRQELISEYGKIILFDYSYRHFYDDGYGKDFQVLNLARGREDQAFELLLGGLLTFYQQLKLFQEKGKEFRPYNLEKPLWIFLGSSVNAVYSREGRKRSDVATVVSFLKRFLENSDWAIDRLGKILAGQSGFSDQTTQEDLFLRHLPWLRDAKAQALYFEITQNLFLGRGGLELWEIKNADGEVGLRVSTSEGQESPYFGVINIGDVSAFKKHLEDTLGLEVREDRFHSSLFSDISRPDSPVNLLVGSKKFIEGWSSWRVSSMGLLNMGKGEGSQVIQLFGRGVRLKGKKWTLKRSTAVPEEGPHPEGLSQLEKLFIFGWNADYIQAFRKMLEEEDMGREIQVPIQQIQYSLWSKLPVPRPKAGYRVDSETWVLEEKPLQVKIDLTPQITYLEGTSETTGEAGDKKLLNFLDHQTAGLLDLERLFIDLLEYKASRQYYNVFIPFKKLLPILKKSDLYVSSLDIGNPDLIQEGASRILRTYLDRFVALREREAEGRYLEPAPLSIFRDSVTSYYTVRTSSEELLKELEQLVKKPKELLKENMGKPLPRLYLDNHLFNPILLNPEDFKELEGMTVSPPGLQKDEAKFIRDLRDFWKANHNQGKYQNLEVFLLRNLPRAGVGFFKRSGFFPDFILWIKDKKTKSTRVRFLEPHGLHHGGLSGNRDKFDALRDLQKLSQEKPFQKKKIKMSGYVLTRTDLKKIPGAEDKDWPTLEKEYPVLRQEGDYMEKVFAAGKT
jgi:hypothetical protein